MRSFKRGALLAIFCAAAFLVLTNAKAQTTSGNPNPGPVGIDSSSVMVCDPYNPMNCQRFTAPASPNSGVSAAQTLAASSTIGGAEAIAGSVTTFPGPQFVWPGVPQLSRWRASCQCFTNAP